MNDNIKNINKMILLTEVKLLYDYNGKKCHKCGLIQGLPNDKLGVRIWYCDWVYNSVNKKLKKIKNKMMSLVITKTVKNLNYLGN